MDPIKKRKIEDNGVVITDHDAFTPLMLTLDDARKILEPFTRDALLEIVQKALLRHPDVLDAVRSVADHDTTQRKLFIRGLGWETTTENLRAIFSSYGELDEAVVILDKVTGKSKGYGFVTYKHIDGAMMSLKEPNKKIDGRMTVTQLAAAGISGGGRPGTVGGVGGVSSPVDVSTRKIYVANVPYDMLAERLHQHFSMYGEIDEGPLGYDKVTGKSKGFALFIYKTAEAARASLVDPFKNIDGHQLSCKLAIDGKRGKPPGTGSVGHGVQSGNQGNGDGNGLGTVIHGGPYTGPGGVTGQYGGVGGPGSSAIGSQAAGSNMGVSGGFGSGVGGPYASGYHFGGSVGTGYGGSEGAGGGLGGTGAALGGVGSGMGAGTRLGGGFGGTGAGFGSAGGGSGGAARGLGGGGGGMGGAGRGSSWYGMPPSSAGTGSVDYLQNSHYSMSSSVYQGQHNQQAGASPAPRVPPGGVYQGMHPYY